MNTRWQRRGSKRFIAIVDDHGHVIARQKGGPSFEHFSTEPPPPEVLRLLELHKEQPATYLLRGGFIVHVIPIEGCPCRAVVVEHLRMRARERRKETGRGAPSR